MEEVESDVDRSTAFIAGLGEDFGEIHATFLTGNIFANIQRGKEIDFR